MDLNLGPLALVDLCDDVERAFRPVAEQNNLAFRIERDTELAAAFVTDEQRLQQILRNLLSNAFKFTDEGSVTLRIMPEAPGIIAFEVEDTGVGIPEDKLSLIFEAFQQADGTTSRKYGGTGLGLNISREIARLLGGELRVKSTSGVGSTFTLSLPIGTRATEPTIAEPIEPVAAPAAVEEAQATVPTTTVQRSSRATACCSSSRTTRGSHARRSAPRAIAASRALWRAGRRSAWRLRASTGPTRC